MNSVSLQKTFYLFYLGFFFILAGASQSYGAATAGYSEYFIPGDEDNMSYILDNIGAGNQSGPMHVIISVTAWADNTIVYYDHWENGYGFDPNDPRATADEEYLISNRGGSEVFEESNVPLPRTVTSVKPDGSRYHDGRDRIYISGGSATVSRASWTESAGTLLALAWEIYPVRPQLTTYILPFGEDLAVADPPIREAYEDFERVYALVQATEDNTVLRVDLDKDGIDDDLDWDRDPSTGDAVGLDGSTYTLHKGEVFLLDRVSIGDQAINGAAVNNSTNDNVLIAGTTIQATNTIQVQYVVGDQGSNYQIRGLSAFPRGFWDDEYYAPVNGPAANDPVDIFLYNPHDETLTISWETQTASNTFLIPPKTTLSFSDTKAAGIYVPQDSSVYLKGDDVFWGVSTIDTEDQVHDWAYSLVPAFLLDVEHFIGWAPGAFPTSTGGSANDSGVYVSAASENVRLYVDYDNDGSPDDTYDLARLQSQYIFDSSDGDMSDTHFYATGPYTLAYGQNPDTAAEAEPAIDVGYTSIPGNDFIELVLTVDKSVSPQVLPTAAGAEAQWSLEVKTYDFSIDDISVVDTLPSGWEYVQNTTTITFPDSSTKSDNPSGTTTLTWDSAIMGDLAPNQSINITFTARTTQTFTAGDISRNEVEVEGSRTVEGVTQTFTTTDFAFVTFADSSLEIEKTTGGIDPLTPGDLFTYTVDVTNPYYDPNGSTFTDVSVYDPLPDGISYTANSSSYTITSRTYTDIADDFSGGQIYNDSSGTVDWSSLYWSETDDGGSGATGGNVLIPSGQQYLQIGGVAGGSNSIERQVNLSSALEANLSLDYSPLGAVSTDDDLILSIFDGSTWTELHRFSDTSQSLSLPINDYLASTTTIRLATDTGDFITSGSTEDVEDIFGSQQYDNNDGSQTWDSNWLETNDDNSPTGGAIQVRGGTDNDLQFTGVVGESVSIRRIADLSGATSATLTLDYTPDASVDSTDELILEASSGGNSFTELTRFSNSGISYGSSGNLNTYIGTNTTIRLRTDTGDYINSTERAVDDFASDSVSGGTGWNGNWIEDGESDGISSGGLRIRKNKLRIQRANLAWARRVDLSTWSTWNGVTINFTVADANNPDATHPYKVQVCYNSTAGTAPTGITCPSWTDILTGDGTSQGTTPESRSISVGSSYLTSSFAIRFLREGSDNTGRYEFDDISIETYQQKYVHLDNVKIEYSSPDSSGLIDNVRVDYVTGTTVTTSPTSANDPPNFIQSDDNLDLPRGATLTLTFDVAVDDPLATGINEIRNTAYVTADKLLVPLTDDATNIVNNPSSQTGEIGDLVWFDLNGDGIKDLGENGLSNVKVTLKDRFGTPLATTVTDGNGRYRFTGIEAGSGYYVQVTGGLPSDLVQTAPTGQPDNQSEPVSLSAGQIYLDADLGYTSAPGTAIIGDYIWQDSDGDGVQDPSEQGLANITVQLFIDANGDGVLQPSELSAEPVDTQVTGADGSYLFTGVTASGSEDYFVSVDGSQSNLTNFTATTATLTSLTNIDAGESHLLNDFGFRADPSNPRYSYKDRVWFDENEDQNDDGESTNGISGVTVDLLDASLNVIATTITLGDGTFEFVGLDPSTFYTVSITDNNSRLTDYFGTTSNAVSGEFKITNITGDIDYTTEPLEPHFGYSVDGTIGDTVFNDINGDGDQDSGELGIAGVAVTLYHDANGNGVLDGTEASTAVATQTTDANGNYMFSGLDDDDYIVSINSNPTGFTNYTSEPSEPSGDDDPASGAQQSVIISNGNSILTADFGYQAPIQRNLSGTVWYDADNEGDLDGTETGVENVTVELYKDTDSDGVIDTGEPLLITTTTASDGTYQFTGLPSGNYVVVVTDTYGMLNNYQTTFEVSEGALASSYDSEESVDLTSGDVTSIDFGYYRPPIITRAIIGDFTAYVDDGRVVIQWQTLSEHGTIGFYLHRFNEDTGHYSPVHKQFLPGLMHSPSGGTYSLVDETAVIGKRYTYKLIEIEAKGKKRSYGPYSVTAVKKSHSILLSTADANISPMHKTTGIYKKRPHGLSNARNARRNGDISYLKKGRLKKSIHGEVVKITVTENGLYFVDSTEIADVMGISDKRVRRLIKRNKLSLKNQGGSVAYIPAEDNSGVFFFGEEIDSLYTNDNIYQLTSRHARGSNIMQIIEEVPPQANTGYEVFQDTLHFEENYWPITAFFDDPEIDYWFWDYIVAGNPTSGMKDFTLPTPGVAGIGTALLQLNLMGSSETDHHIALLLNGEEIGDSYWNGTVGHTVEISIDQALLNDGDNLVEVKGLLDTGAPYSVFYIDSFDLTLYRQYMAVDDSLVVRGDGNSVVTIDNFSSDDIQVFNLSDRRHPKLLTGTTIEELDSYNYQVSFSPEGPNTEYLAITLGATKDVVSVSADKPSNLRAKHNGADYLIIAPLELLDASNRLAEYRAQNGYTTMVVELENIMDQFNYGIVSPHAIKDFLAHAYAKWQQPPIYVVLAGDGSFDYKNHQGNDDCLLPPLMGSTPHGLFAMDNLFADISGNDSLPELAIGRIPVLTADEMNRYVDKVIAFETSTVWPKKALMLADYTDINDPFTEQSDTITRFFPSNYVVEKAYLSEDSLSVARSKILSAINSNLSIVNFVGHGGLDRFSSDGMLITSDGAEMTNTQSPFLITALTCMTGRFDLSGYDTLSETLILQENGGAVAVWSSTGLSEAYEAQILGENFYQILFDDREVVTLGVAAARAIHNYSKQGKMTYMLDLYNLLGDPALSIR